ncbi:OmpA family protein [Fibrella sp. HMF5335]|uniref:OmpA family protein n=1 Tax=Fibrella rubiginis TaxID=2817060 RepID=A0A939GDQ1_9BACT|nr:OmpA family protein [Fibrella rubiginis]MBO0934950.1 OmpA family protein [Fibrella rubiginis]
MTARPSIYLWLLFWGLCVPVLAQSTLKQADQQFAQLAYANAAELYEGALGQARSTTENEVRSIRYKLGECYRQLRNTQQAERVYRDLVGEGKLPTSYTDAYLHFAQALASNGKYKEAQEAYETFTSLQTSNPIDPRGPRFSALYSDVSALTSNSGSYRVDFLDLNTRKAEFSPMYFRNGLVFVTSAGADNSIRRVFNWDNSPFLDLYYVPDMSVLKADDAARMGGGKSGRKALRQQSYRLLGRDDFTARTANDSRTVGVFGGNQVQAGEGYDIIPMSESDQFSRSLNTKYHEGPATFSRDGSRVIFTRNNFNNGHERKSSEGINKLKLYTAKQTSGAWSDIEEMPFNSDEYSTGHPTLTADNLTLYFASDMPGGFGGTDIYSSRWDGNRWSAPVNMGAAVNSKGNELFPFVDEKNNLYFSSDGLPGLGDLDVFFAQISPSGKATGVVRNLGEPINSAKDDFGIITDGDRKGGFFSSNRKNGGADDDIYRFKREGSLYPCRQLTVALFDAQTHEPLPNTPIIVQGGEPGNDHKALQTDAKGNIRLCVNDESDLLFTASHTGYLASKVGFSTRNLQDDLPSRLDMALTKPTLMSAAAGTTTGEIRDVNGHVVSQKDGKALGSVKVVLINQCDGSRQEVYSDADGNYSFSSVAGCEYLIEGAKDRMATKGGRVRKDGTGDTKLLMFSAGDIMRIEDIYYDLNKAEIRSDAATELDKLVALLTKYPDMKIEMRSHTDSRATTQYNKRLSGNRATAAINYMASKGIARRRLRAKGYGESALVNGCADGVDCTEEQHQQNRRTEIKILTVE